MYNWVIVLKSERIRDVYRICQETRTLVSYDILVSRHYYQKNLLTVPMAKHLKYTLNKFTAKWLIWTQCLFFYFGSDLYCNWNCSVFLFQSFKNVQTGDKKFTSSSCNTQSHWVMWECGATYHWSWKLVQLLGLSERPPDWQGVLVLCVVVRFR